MVSSPGTIKGEVKPAKGWTYTPPLSDDEEEEDVEHITPSETNQMNKEPKVEDINP